MIECEHRDCAEEETNERHEQQHHQIENCDRNNALTKSTIYPTSDKINRNSDRNRLNATPNDKNNNNSSNSNCSCSNDSSDPNCACKSQNIVNGCRRDGDEKTNATSACCPVINCDGGTTNLCDTTHDADASDERVNAADKLCANSNRVVANGKPRALPRQSIVVNGAKSNSVENRPKPILSNGSLVATDKGESRQSQFISKKSVSFDTSNDSVNKFISGDVIIDKENPFKRLNAQKRAEFFSQPKITALICDDEFVSTADVLKESKYVKTYIKNPDEFFVYDPTLKERLLREEARERADKQKERNLTPKKVSRISRLTHERLKELKNKYSPPPLYGQSKIRSALLGNGTVKSSLAHVHVTTPVAVNGHHVNGGTDTIKSAKVQPNKKKIDRSRYPELSQIKVRVGTDLEGSFFNPKEVALNVKKFDARIKKAQFGSQDDLDEITDLTSTFTPNGRDEPAVDLDENDHASSIVASHVVESTPVPADSLPIESKSDENSRTHTFTNTVNSKEFQDYLKQKGLTLLPDTNGKKVRNGGRSNGEIALRIIEPGDDHTVNEMDTKKTTKKSSVLQRLFPNGIFSSRRKTTPKEATPEPKRLGGGDDTRFSVAKRLVLHRQSLPPQSTSSTVATPTATTRAHLTPAGPNAIDYDDRSSSISSALTNAENDDPETPPKPVAAERRTKSNHDSCSDFEASKSLSGIRYIDSSSNSTIVACDTDAKQKPQPRLRHTSGRSSVPVMISSVGDRFDKMRSCSSSVTPQSKHRKEAPLTFENKTPDIRDGIVKPRVYRPQLIGGQRYVDPAALSASPKLSSISTPIVGKRTVDRPTALMMPKKLSENGKLEARKRMPPKLPERKAAPVTGQPTASSLHRARTPTLNESSGGPKSTSTPNGDSDAPKNRGASSDFYFHPRNPNVSPIARPTEPVADRKAAAKSDRTAPDPWSERQLYSQPLLVYTNAEPMQNVYERVPVQKADANGSMGVAAPLYAKVEKRAPGPSSGANFVRQTPMRQSLDQNSLQRRQFIPAPQPMEPTIFVRNSPQRNTITGAYSPQLMMRMPGAPYSLLMTQQPQQLLLQQQQPPRAQSVLDEMISGRTAVPGYMPNVVLRRKPAHALTREEIMNQVTEFCRKSMNRTPTKFMAGSNEQMLSKTSSEVSPISYTSMDSKTSPSIASSRSAKIAPQVPLRVQSLQSTGGGGGDKIVDHPIYEPIFKRGSTHSETTTAMMLASASSPTHNKRVSFAQKRQQQMQQRTCSETDSAFVSDENTPSNGHYQVPKRYVVMDSENVTPTHVMKFQTAAAIAAKQSPLAIHAAHHTPYGYIPYRDGTNAPPCSPQIFFQPTLLQPNVPSQKLHRVSADGRTTPILLQPQQQPVHQTSPIPSSLPQTKSSGGRIVVLDNVEQFYRPIAASAGSASNRLRLVPRTAAYPFVGKQINYVRSGNQIIPYECNTTNDERTPSGRLQCDGKFFIVLFFAFK